MHVTALYVALATLLVLILGVRVSLGRRRAKVGIGDGGDHDLSKRIRAHANALENVPLALLLLLMLELSQVRPLWLHVFGCLLILGDTFAAGMFGWAPLSGLMCTFQCSVPSGPCRLISSAGRPVEFAASLSPTLLPSGRSVHVPLAGSR